MRSHIHPAPACPGWDAAQSTHAHPPGCAVQSLGVYAKVVQQLCVMERRVGDDIESADIESADIASADIESADIESADIARALSQTM
jgi:hypothetical protein